MFLFICFAHRHFWFQIFCQDGPTGPNHSGHPVPPTWSLCAKDHHGSVLLHLNIFPSKLKFVNCIYFPHLVSENDSWLKSSALFSNARSSTFVHLERRMMAIMRTMRTMRNLRTLRTARPGPPRLCQSPTSRPLQCFPHPPLLHLSFSPQL